MKPLTFNVTSYFFHVCSTDKQLNNIFNCCYELNYYVNDFGKPIYNTFKIKKQRRYKQIAEQTLLQYFDLVIPISNIIFNSYRFIYRSRLNIIASWYNPNLTFEIEPNKAILKEGTTMN